MQSIRNLSDRSSAEAAFLIRDHLDGFQIRIEDLQYHVDQSHNSTQAVTSPASAIPHNSICN